VQEDLEPNRATEEEAKGTASEVSERQDFLSPQVS
jgi:hypothetical protein